MRKGFGATNLTYANIAALVGGTSPIRIHTSWGNWLKNETLYDFSNLNVKWYPILGYGGLDTDPNFQFWNSSHVPNNANILAVCEHPNYDGWWALGNEPYLTAGTHQTWWDNEGKPQYDAIVAVDSLAKIIIPAGCAGCNGNNNAQHWGANSWFHRLLTVIPSSYLTQNGGRIKAYHWHLYPGPMSIIDVLNEDLTLRAEPTINPLQSFITEVGRPTDSGQDKFNPAYVLQKCEEKGINETSWYRQAPTGGSGDNYYMLQDSPPTLTAYGTQWKNY